MFTRKEFSRDADALFAHVDACWADARAGSAIPRRQALSPAKLGRALPFVSLIDVIPGPPMDFQYRLMGQHVISNLGQNLTGKRTLELPPASPEGRPMYSAYVTCVKSAKPARLDLDILNMNGTKRRLQVLILPLGDDGRTPDALLGTALFLD